MSEIIPFPIAPIKPSSDIDAVIDTALSSVPHGDREKLRFALIKTIDSYDAYFTEWNLEIPKDGSESLKKQIYDIARQEHERKMLMLKDIIRLKIKVLVTEYHQRG